MKATLTRWIKGLTSLTQQRKAGPAPVFHYKGFDIPQDLILKTGGGPETFDVISRLHIYNLQRLVGIRPDDQIIEVGSGIGRDAIPLTEILSSRGSYLGVDIIEQSIAWCHSAISSRHPNFRFHHYDVQDQLHNPNGCTKTTDIRFPVEDGSIDRIILQSVFTHMLKSDILHYLREFRRVLKKDGLVYATLFLYDDAILECARRTNLTQYDLRFEHEWATGCRVNGLDCPTGAVAYTEEAFNALIAEAGLQRVGDYGRGAWSGFFKDGVDGQDVAILAKQ